MHSGSSTKSSSVRSCRAGGSRPTTRASPRGGASGAGARAASGRARRRARRPGRPARRRRAVAASASSCLLACGELLGRLAARRHRPRDRAERALRPRRAALRASSRSCQRRARSRRCCTPRSRRAVAVVVRLEALLVGDDAAAGVHHLARRALHVELLDLLERVRLGRRCARPGARRRRGRRTRSPRSSSSTSVSRVPCAPMSRLIAVGS